MSRHWGRLGWAAYVVLAINFAVVAVWDGQPWWVSFLSWAVVIVCIELFRLDAQELGAVCRFRGECAICHTQTKWYWMGPWAWSQRRAQERAVKEFEGHDCIPLDDRL